MGKTTVDLCISPGPRLQQAELAPGTSGVARRGQLPWRARRALLEPPRLSHSFFPSIGSATVRIVRATLAASLTLATLLCSVGSAQMQLRTSFVPQTLAEQAALRRGWVIQLPDIGPRSHLVHVVLGGDLLVTMSSAGIVSAIETESGHIRWTVQMGTPGFPVLPPAIDDQNVVVAHGQKIYMIDRQNGRVIWQHTLTGTPYLSPTLLEKYVATPVLPGQFEVVDRLSPENRVDPNGEIRLVNPIRLSTSSQLAGPAIVVEDFLAWADVQGTVVAVAPQSSGQQFRIEADGPVATTPVWYENDVLVGTLTGYLHSYDDRHGLMKWTFAADEEIRKPLLVVGDRIFVVAEHRGLWAVNRLNGEMLWFCPDVRDVASVSPAHVYTLDRWNRLAILDVATGRPRMALPLPERTLAVANMQSDRMFLFTRDGVVQQMHEQLLNSPLKYQAPKSAADPNERRIPLPGSVRSTPSATTTGTAAPGSSTASPVRSATTPMGTARPPSTAPQPPATTPVVTPPTTTPPPAGADLFK